MNKLALTIFLVVFSIATAFAIVHNAFEFRDPVDNVTKATLNSNGDMVAIGSMTAVAAQFGAATARSTFTISGYLIMGGAIALKGKTITELYTTTPTYVGEMFYPTNSQFCALAVATQTISAEWVDGGDRTIECQ